MRSILLKGVVLAGSILCVSAFSQWSPTTTSISTSIGRTGYVCIGGAAQTVSPFYKLKVVGTSRFEGTSNFWGPSNFGGGVMTLTSTSTSTSYSPLTITTLSNAYKAISTNGKISSGPINSTGSITAGSSITSTGGIYADLDITAKNKLTVGYAGCSDFTNTIYGDLNLLAGNGTLNSGWLTANMLISNSDASISGSCYVYGDLDVRGTKNFVQPHPTDTTKEIVYVAVESNEALTHVRGSAKTVNGKVTIKLPADFALVTSSEANITAQITCIGVPALLYVASKSKEQLVVNIKSDDFYSFGDVTFDYTVEGVRDGFEDHKTIRSTFDGGKNIQLSPKRKMLNEKNNRIMNIKKMLREKTRTEN